jgi:hypothetical protein
LAKALKSSAFWKLAIAITWIVRLYGELNIIVNVQHINCQKCAPVYQLRML